MAHRSLLALPKAPHCMKPPLWPSGEKPPGCVGCIYEKRRIHGAKFQFVAGHGPARARLAVFAEAPGKHEVGHACGDTCTHPQGEPLVGPTGGVVAQAGCGRDAAFRSNIRKCVPPDKETPADYAASVAHCTRAYLVPEVLAFGEEWRHICLLGAESLEAWTGLTKIGKYHGSHFTRAEVEALREVSGMAEEELAEDGPGIVAEEDEEDEDDAAD